ncbi:MAG: hypothetical protein ACK2TT_03040 [Anaerolineales bacterium]|jgi:hypothetical protein
MSQVKILILAAFPIYFIALWCFILWLIALAGGWKKLSGHYRQLGDFQGQILRMQSARLNWSNYSNILRIGLSERGLYMSPMVLFRPFHPPLLIPWEEIEAEPFQQALWRGYRLRFRSVPGVRLELYQGTFQQVLDFLEGYPDRLHIDKPERKRY